MTHGAPTLALLEWIADQPRSYVETIEAWRTSCPGLATWDDAVSDGLVRVVPMPGSNAKVALTPARRAFLAGDAELASSARSSG